MIKGATNTSLKIGCFNARSICNKVPAVLELLTDNKVDICFLTESWLKVSDKAKYAEIREYGYNILSAPRKGCGGGVGFLFNPKTVDLKKHNVKSYKSFEVLEAVLKDQSELIRLSVIYRTTQFTSKAKYADTRRTLFYQEFTDYLEVLHTKPGRPIISGDFNFHMEDKNNIATKKFIDVYTSKGFTQHNTMPTHNDSILDLVLTSKAICDQVSITDLHVVDENVMLHCSLDFIC